MITHVIFNEICKLISSQLVKVKPEERMTLKDARKALDELETFTDDFLLLTPLQSSVLWDDMVEMDGIANTRLFTIPTTSGFKSPWAMTRSLEDNETPQTYFVQMDGITSTNLYTTSTMENGKKLTQRRTNLCVSITAMRLLSYALVYFLRRHRNSNSTAREDLDQSILKYPNPFIDKLITICCGVISPRSLNGLNRCKLDDDFQIAAQEQNIRKYKY